MGKEQKEQIEIHLRYGGPDVEDGSMSVEDIVPVLQGFSSAYGKLASIDSPESTHRIRIVGVKPGSADIILEVWKFLGDNVEALKSTAIVAGGALFVVRKIMGVIKAKRHVKKKPFTERINANNSIVITNADNVSIEVPLEIFKLFKGGHIDSDLNRMMRPLEKDRIDSAEFSARAPDGTILKERVTAEERPYFDTEETVTATTRETRLIVKLNSLTKSTNNGWAYLSDGTRVFYSYVGNNPSKLYNLFSYQGPVEVSCDAHFDENLKVIKLEVRDLERTTNDLFSTNHDSEKADNNNG